MPRTQTRTQTETYTINTSVTVSVSFDRDANSLMNLGVSRTRSRDGAGVFTDSISGSVPSTAGPSGHTRILSCDSKDPSDTFRLFCDTLEAVLVSNLGDARAKDALNEISR